jgi:hypothetical protein
MPAQQSLFETERYEYHFYHSLAIRCPLVSIFSLAYDFFQPAQEDSEIPDSFDQGIMQAAPL